MLAISCSACQKKLAVKEDAIGKKVKCPGCGTLTVVPAAVAAGAGPTVATSEPSSDSLTGGNKPTHASSDAPDVTQGLDASAKKKEKSLTDFLAPPQAADELGRLGKYRILKILGHGGMGVVYKAEDPKLKRTVAIKAMLPALAASGSAAERFTREAEAMAKVEHDHIVRIYEINEDRNIPFMAMEFLKGEPLDERLKRDDKLPLADILRIGREIARALDAAHKTGLIHRDIKPANVWLEAPEDRVKILDFGLARAASGESGLTQQGAIIGTPSFMSPEQARGEAVDTRCDLFSLGVVLYRLSTGQQPFKGNDTVGTLMSVAMHEPPAPVMVNLELPPEVSDLVMKLLEKDHEKRMQTAAEVVQAIKKIEQRMAMEKKTNEKTQPITVAVPVTKKKSLDHVLFAVDDPPPATSVAPPKKAAAPVLPSPSGRGAGGEGEPRRRSKDLFALAAAALFGIALIAAGIVFFWPTPDGLVRIEINDPTIKVSFDDKDLVFSGIDKQDIRVTPGKHGLDVKRGDLEFKTDHFLLKKGETITLKIEWDPKGKLQVVQGDKVIGEKTAKKTDVPVVPGVDYALSFTRDDRVELAQEVAIDDSSDFTIEGFITLSGKYGVVVANPVMRVQTSAQPWQFFVKTDGQNVSLGDKGPAAQYLNRRIHLAGVRAGGELRFFVEGRLVSTKPLDGKVPKSLGNWKIGGAEGVIDEVRISKVARYDKDFTPAKRFEPDKDTIALYHFDEGTGDVLKDSSGNNHHGKIVGAKWVKADGTPITIPAPSGTPALAFDGKSSYVDVPTLERNALKPATLEGWVRTGGQKTVCLLMRVDGKAPVQFHVHDLVLRGIERSPNNTPAREEHRGVSAAQKIKPNSWTHLAFVADERETRVFINGKISATQPGTFPKLFDPPLVRGSRIGGDDGFGFDGTPRKFYFEGEMASLRLSKVARYDKDFTPAKRFEPDKDTVALYHFDEGEGEVLKDSSGNNHHGKIVGAKWVKADGTTALPPIPDAWFKEVAALPAKEQVKAVADKLKERNPGFDGKVTPLFEKADIVMGVVFSTDNVTNISPVRAFPELRVLQCDASYGGMTQFADLSPLKGMKLTNVNCRATRVADLSPLKDMKLTVLTCPGTKVADLSPLKEMTMLINLDCGGTLVADLSPLKDMKLTAFRCDRTNVTDLSLLKGMPLKILYCDFVPQRDAELLRSIKTLETINGKDAKQFWKEVDAGPRSGVDDAWVKQVAALPAKEQVEAVKAELMKRNPGFDGKLTPVIDKAGVVTRLSFSTDNVTDISPVRAILGLRVLACIGTPTGGGKLADLSTLKGMKLTELHCQFNKKWPTYRPSRE